LRHNRNLPVMGSCFNMRDGYPIPLYSVGTLNTQIIEKEI
jgi:hypothetical protein